MRVLVTGASGFIGTSFCERFGTDPGVEVVAVDRRAPMERFPRVEHVPADLCDGPAIRRVLERSEPEVIVHLAAQARVEPSLASVFPTYSDNVTGTVNLIGAAEHFTPKLERFVYASSETVYGPAARLPSDEASPLHPDSPYAASKAACELLVGRAFPQKALILRSGMGYGPRSDPSAQVVARFITRALRGRPILFPADSPAEGHPTRDVNHVSNFLDGLGLALSSGATGTFNIASGREVSILELAQSTVDAVGAGQIEFTSAFRYRRGEAGLRTWLSVEKAKHAFGYMPKVSLDHGLRSTIGWYRTHPDYFAERAAPLPPWAR